MASPLRSFSVTAGSDIPECMICSEWFDDKDADLIPRNLACGHSLCSSEALVGPAVLYVTQGCVKIHCVLPNFIAF